MLENSYGLTFFLKTPKNKSNCRFIYLRITVDSIPKETSTKRKWDISRWNQETGRAIGNKEDARGLNKYLDSLELNIQQYQMELSYNNRAVSAQKLIDYVLGKSISKVKVLQEFQMHNEEMAALVKRGEYAEATHERYVTTKTHVLNFMKFKLNVEDIEFRELNFEFVKDFEFYLKTMRNCSNNTTLKYISNFKKIVYRAIDKDIISSDPFKNFKGKKIKIMKKPLSSEELFRLENHYFSNPRLAVVRDVFVFQCYTGLAYIDVYQLTPDDIKIGIDGEHWIMSARQKTGSETNIPLLSKAIEIIEHYKQDALCLQRGSLLPVRSNQKMNAYLKEIADICGITSPLNTHKARRTFGSTVTLANNVPIHIVKEMLGHHSVRQTEEYAITTQKSIGYEMQALKQKLSPKADPENQITIEHVQRLERELSEMRNKLEKLQKAS